MPLSINQIEFYHENGYLFIENYLDEKEIEILCKELPKTIDIDSPRIILEDNGSVRSVFAPHFINDTYYQLSRLERFVIPSEQLIGNKIYLHQYKINTKKGLLGDWWEWHQDFPYWYNDDGIMSPDLVSIMLYLQDTDPSNGALLFIPKSQKLGIAKFAEKNLPVFETVKNDKEENYLSSLTSNIKFTVHHDLIRELANANGIKTASGKKGSVLFFHPNIFHASNMNLSPFDRDAVIITYNSVFNLPTNIQNPRPDFLVGRSYEPIEDVRITIDNSN